MDDRGVNFCARYGFSFSFLSTAPPSSLQPPTFPEVCAPFALFRNRQQKARPNETLNANILSINCLPLCVSQSLSLRCWLAGSGVQSRLQPVVTMQSGNKRERERAGEHTLIKQRAKNTENQEREKKTNHNSNQNGSF